LKKHEAVTVEPMHSNIEVAKIEEVLQQVRSALNSGAEEDSRAALLACLQILASLGEVRQPVQSSKYDGSIEYTFEDESYEPFGRAVDVRIHYRWCNYNPADNPRPLWGATIEDLEVLAIRYFDNAGNEVHSTEHPLDVAWHLLHKCYQQVTEACTEDGYRRGAGSAPPTYAPGRRVNAASPSLADIGTRMAPSVPTRPAQLDRRQLG
jgi:hypothetical protein